MKIEKELSEKMAAFSLFCAVLVVFIHIYFDVTSETGALWWVWICMAEGICRIAVPFFFVAAGFWLAGHMAERGWWPREVVKRVRTLIVPFVLWNLLWYLFCCLICLLANVKGGRALVANFPQVPILQVFGLDINTTPILGLMWFVRALFLLVVISPLIDFVLSWGWRLLLVGYAIMLLPTLCKFSAAWEARMSVFMPLSAVFFFSAGIFLRKRKLEMGKHGYRCLFIIGFIGAVVFVYMRRCNLYGSNIVHLAMLPVWLGCVWKMFPCVVLPSFLCGCAFPVYLMHQFVIQAIKPYHNSPSLIGYFVVGCIAILLPIIFVNVLRRVSNRSIQILFGGR